MLFRIKGIRKLIGGKWYKVEVSNLLFSYNYYTKTKPNKVNHRILEKKRY